MNYKAGGEGDKKDEYDLRKKSSFDVPDLLKQQSANRSADVGKNEFSKGSHNLQKPLKQDRPTPKSPHEAVSTGEVLTRNSKHDMLRNDITRDDNAVNKQTPVKSPRTDFMSLKPKNQFEQSRQNHKSQSSFQQDVPTKSQQPVKSPRPTSQLQPSKPTKPTKHFSEKPEKINTEANLKQDYNEPVKKERPTKSPRPLANHNDQQKEGSDKFTKKFLDGEVAYSKNLSKFNDLMGSGSGGIKSKDEKTTARKNEKQSFEKPQKDDRKDEEIDSLFDIGGKSSSVKKSYKVDNNNVEPDYRHRKTVEDRRENKAGFDFEKSHQGKIERERADDRDDVEKKRKEPTTTPKHRNETDDPLSRRGEMKSDRSKSTNARGVSRKKRRRE